MKRKRKILVKKKKVSSPKVVAEYGQGPTHVVVESGIAIPKDDGKRMPYVAWKHILPQMKQGESFVVRREPWRTSLMRAAEAMEIEIFMRQDKDGNLRCWRI